MPLPSASPTSAACGGRGLPARQMLSRGSLIVTLEDPHREERKRAPPFLPLRALKPESHLNKERILWNSQRFSPTAAEPS